MKDEQKEENEKKERSKTVRMTGRKEEGNETRKDERMKTGA